MLVVAVTAPRVRQGRRVWTALRRLWARLLLAAAGGTGAGLRGVLTLVLALRGVGGLALVSFGAWLAYEPAGFITAGVLVLADRVADERRPRREQEDPIL